MRRREKGFPGIYKRKLIFSEKTICVFRLQHTPGRAAPGGHVQASVPDRPVGRSRSVMLPAYCVVSQHQCVLHVVRAEIITQRADDLG